MTRRSLCLLTAITLVVAYGARPEASVGGAVSKTTLAGSTPAPVASYIGATATPVLLHPTPLDVTPVAPSAMLGDYSSAVNPNLTQKPTPKPRGGGIAGWATYYGSGQGYTGAINHRLGHVGQVAVVCGGAPFHCRSISIVDVCACGDRHGEPTLIDLSPFAFADFGPLSAGVIHISMEVLP